MTTCISASGKVLIAGGYLVLDRAHAGVVVSTSSRFYTVVRPDPALAPNTIRVRSPQFESATWTYDVDFADAAHPRVEQRYGPRAAPHRASGR
jgi:phosphomevalonate kinase